MLIEDEVEEEEEVVVVEKEEEEEDEEEELVAEDDDSITQLSSDGEAEDAEVLEEGREEVQVRWGGGVDGEEEMEEETVTTLKAAAEHEVLVIDDSEEEEEKVASAGGLNGNGCVYLPLSVSVCLPRSLARSLVRARSLSLSFSLCVYMVRFSPPPSLPFVSTDQVAARIPTFVCVRVCVCVCVCQVKQDQVAAGISDHLRCSRPPQGSKG